MTSPDTRAERDRCAALLRSMADERASDPVEHAVLLEAARRVERCRACHGCGMASDSTPCPDCDPEIAT